jgi:hypothetical protein
MNLLHESIKKSTTVLNIALLQVVPHLLGGFVILCDILTQGLIGLTEYSYHQDIPSFSGSPTEKNSGLSVFSPKQFQNE